MASSPAQTLVGKTAIVTGASRGIGAAIALDLAARGAQVALVFVSQSSAPAADILVQKISHLESHRDKDHTAAIAIRADLCEVDAPGEIVRRALAELGGKVDILVNNAAVNSPATLAEMTRENYDEIFNTNVKAVVFMTQAVLPYLPERNGRIINIGSTAGRVAVPTMSLYTATKVALEALTRSWAAELGHRGATVNTVAPGSTQSDLLKATMPAELMAWEEANTPAGRRIGEPEDVAPIVAWLASDESKWISGQTICASGGYRMY